MKIFGLDKNIEKTNESGCCCGEGDCCTEISQNEESSVKVLGSGCAKCNELEKNTIAALAELGMNTAIKHVTDYKEIASYGVMSTPALVIDGKVVAFGKVLKKDEVIKILKELEDR